ncbi:MAG: translation factor, partial [Isosphaeraceae bacterium]
MDRTTSEPERIDLSRADDLRDVVHQAVATLVQGQLVALVHDDHLTLCAGATHPSAADSLAAAIQGFEETRGPTTLLLRGCAELRDWVPSVSRVADRLARRAWPGPLALSFATVDES